MLAMLQPLLAIAAAAAAASGEAPRPDGSGAAGDRLVAPSTPASAPTCTPKLLGANLDSPGHDLVQTAVPQTSQACANSCCANPKCTGALFEPQSAVKFGGCLAGKPCCFMKSGGVTGKSKMPKPVKGGADLWVIPGRSQDDEKLSFLSATLGDHMVLQREPQQAIVWGFTAPGATVTTTMAPSLCATDDGRSAGACERQAFKATADKDGTWRQKLPPMPASKKAYSFTFASSSAAAEKASMDDVLFGDVFMCGGQSNSKCSCSCLLIYLLLASKNLLGSGVCHACGG